MRSAKQTIEYELQAQLVVADINANTAFVASIESPLSGWLKDAVISVSMDDVDQNTAFLVSIGTREEWGRLSNIANYLFGMASVWSNSARQIASYISDQAIHMFYHTAGFGANVSSDYKKKVDLNTPVQRGDVLYVFYLGTDLGTNLTSGTVDLRVQFEFLVGSLPFLNADIPKGKSERTKVAIVINMDNDENLAYWTPPCKGRISNMRMTLFSSDADTWERFESLYFGKDMKTKSVMSQDTVRTAHNGIMLTGPTTGNSFVTKKALTAYSREILFAEQGELFKIELLTSNTDSVQAFLEFDFIPDFNAPVNYLYSYKKSNLTAGDSMELIQIPFDMYLERIDWDIKDNDSSWEGKIYIMTITDFPETFTTVPVYGGMVLDQNGVMPSLGGVGPGNVHEVIFHESDTIPNDQNFSGMTAVNRYLPAGSFVVISYDIEAATGTEDMDISLLMKGYSRVKSNKFGINYFEGLEVADVMDL